MSKGLRLPAALRERRLSPPQERLIHHLYAARERSVRHEDLRDAVFDEDADQYRVMRLVHDTRRTIQGTGWHIETDHGRGYRMIWVDAMAPEEPPETLELLRFMAADQRALRADFAMLSDHIREALASLVTVPAHMLVPASTWTREADAAILETKGITGKLAALADATGIDPAAVTSRYKALKASR